MRITSLEATGDAARFAKKMHDRGAGNAGDGPNPGTSARSRYTADIS